MTDTEVPGQRAFLDGLDFEPDSYQLESFAAVDQGQNVVVAAPTGAGKTLVASYAVSKVLANGGRVFYTTPIKALSNQKFNDLLEAYGPDQVGLLTGDNSINPDASVVVMTTEVLRNMLYAGNELSRLQVVVLDEVHYLQDAYRGSVWEEVIIHLPRRIQLVCLSATVSNADELTEWIGTVRGESVLVVETKRPVTLETLYLVGERQNSHLHMMRMFLGGSPNKKGYRFDNDPRRAGKKGGGNRKGGRPRAKWRTPSRVDAVSILAQKDLLPAIYFIFSRAACNDAARAVVSSGLTLTNQAERAEIKVIAARRLEGLSSADLDALDYDIFIRGLEAGVAPHHAGLVPPFKEAVEACFERGLLKAVFATETLALGINMPARTVIIEKLSKFTGEIHEFLTPAQFTQLTGRAGRRGIDTEGRAMVLWSPFVSFEQVSSLASNTDFQLSSSFRPTYNMAANLVRRYEPDRARQLLNLSFAQFRADANIVRSEHRIERLLDRRNQVEGRLAREFGPVVDLVAALADPPPSEDPDEIYFGLSQVVPGEILEIVGPDLSSPVVAVAVALRKGGRIRLKAVDREGETFEVIPNGLSQVPVVVGKVELPDPYLPNSVTFALEVSRLLNRALPDDEASGSGNSTETKSNDTKTEVVEWSAKPLKAEDISAAARKGLRRLERLNSDIVTLEESIRHQVDSLGSQFDRVIGLLEERGHLELDIKAGPSSWHLTASGQRIARVYHECELLVVEAMEEGLFDGLGSTEVAALASCFVYEERRPSLALVSYPTAELKDRFIRLQGLHLNLSITESDAHLRITRQPDGGFMEIAYGWAAGGGLDDVLANEEMTAGDFVRTIKQLVDLLRQIGQLAPVPETARAARQGAEAIFRDLVAASSAIEIDQESSDGDEADSLDD